MSHGLDAIETAQSAASVVQAPGADTLADRILACALTPSLSRDCGPSISDIFRAGEWAKQSVWCVVSRGWLEYEHPWLLQ